MSSNPVLLSLEVLAVGWRRGLGLRDAPQTRTSPLLRCPPRCWVTASGRGERGLACGADLGRGGWWHPVRGQEVSSGCWVGRHPRLQGRLLSPSSRRRASRKGPATRQKSSCRLGGQDRLALSEEAASLQGRAGRGRRGGPGLLQQRAQALSDYTAFRRLPFSEVGQARVRMKEEQCYH